MGYERFIRPAIRRGLEFLLREQGRDGIWRDYDLKPGPAECWTTAWIGLLIAGLPFRHLCGLRLQHARRALLQSTTPAGWGYNRRTGPDADSTAWTLRFLAVFERVPGRLAEELLGPYLDVSGQVHTYRENGVGSWSASHADVTPVAGLAFVATRAAPERIALIRHAVLGKHTPAGWEPFWWTTDAYATWQSLEFLSVSGGIPQHVRESSANWVRSNRLPHSVLECALLLNSASLLGMKQTDHATEFCDALLTTQLSDGGWPSSVCLKVPQKWDGDVTHPPGPFADIRRCVTTANAIQALGNWLSAE